MRIRFIDDTGAMRWGDDLDLKPDAIAFAEEDGYLVGRVEISGTPRALKVAVGGDSGVTRERGEQLLHGALCIAVAAENPEPTES